LTAGLPKMEFGVSRDAIRNAVDGLTFKYLPMPPNR
jgi:hypothetical protein